MADCRIEGEIILATLDDKHLGMLADYVVHGWPLTQPEVQKQLPPYWSFRDENCDN